MSLVLCGGETSSVSSSGGVTDWVAGSSMMAAPHRRRTERMGGIKNSHRFPGEEETDHESRFRELSIRELRDGRSG